MKIKISKILALIVCACLILSLGFCGLSLFHRDSYGEIISEVFDRQKNDMPNNAIEDNITNKIFPMFSNDVDYSRGGATSASEARLDYKEYIKNRHEYADMIDHESEVAAVRLAELGVLQKIENFNPNGTMTVGGFLKALMMVCRQDISGATTNAELDDFIRSTNFLSADIEIDYSASVTNEQMAYFLSRATADTENTEQYRLMISDYPEIDRHYSAGVLKAVKLGLIEIKDYTFNPKSAARRSDIADGLYRLMNTGARLIPEYDLGSLYKQGQSEYLVKTSYNTNEAGTMFGFFSNYNHQAKVFENFGKLPVDRTGFNKWAHIETEAGVYKWPTFGNDSAPHRLGQTSIIGIDISANTNFHYLFEESNIPEFYAQDITNPNTRFAAKTFLYEFVQRMLRAIGGDVLLLIDYELNWQQGIYDTTVAYKGPIFSAWFIEACEVAREAADAIGAGERLKLGVNYDGVGTAALLGPEQNQWMLDMAEVVDYVTIDSYQFYDDKTDPSYTIENLRYLMNNYSLDKPIIMVENGLGINQDNLDETDSNTGLTQTELANGYWKNLFREYRFALERGDFLNSNVAGYLVWSYNTGRTQIADYNTNKLHPWGEIIKRGIDLLYRQNQFNPSYVSSVCDASAGADITVSSGTQYEKLTYVVTDYKTGGKNEQIKIRLSEAGTVFITVNGTKNIASVTENKIHTLNITDGLRDGLNVIDIYFGASESPSKRSIKSLSVSMESATVKGDNPAVAVMGDADQNETVDIRDLIRTKKVAAGETYEINMTAIDLDYDKTVGASDIVRIRKILLNDKFDELGVNLEDFEDTLKTDIY